jgi:hypothetical protein
VTSALRLLVRNLKTELSCTCLERPSFDIDRIAATYAALEAKPDGVSRFLPRSETLRE